jgi:DNA-binding response OmpR family regulator
MSTTPAERTTPSLADDVPAATARRGQPNDLPTGPAVSVGDVTVDPRTYQVQRGSGTGVRLRRKELHLLYELMCNAGAVLPRQHLLDVVWGPGYARDPQTVDVHIARLRRHIGDPRNIRTIRGVGYVYEADNAAG